MLADEPRASPAPPPSAGAPQAGGRDERLDLLRGLCVLLMLLGHLGWLRLRPHFAVGFVTAAEGFFFLSGATLGVVYARYRREGRERGLERRLLLRALWLAFANTLLVALARLFAGTPSFPGEAFFDRYWRQAPEWLRFASLNQPNVLHILPRYSILLLAAPIVLRLLASRAALLVPLGSAALWLAHFLEPRAWRLPLLETNRTSWFPLASWQLLFFAGMTLTMLAVRRATGPRRRVPLPALAAGAALALAIAVWQRTGLPGLGEVARESFLAHAQRGTLGIVRLANFALVAAVLWTAVDRWRDVFGRAAGWILLPLGRNALAAFLLHIPALWIFNLVPWGADSTPARLVAAVAVTAGVAKLVTVPRVRRILAPV